MVVGSIDADPQLVVEVTLVPIAVDPQLACRLSDLDLVRAPVQHKFRVAVSVHTEHKIHRTLRGRESVRERERETGKTRQTEGERDR